MKICISFRDSFFNKFESFWEFLKRHYVITMIVLWGVMLIGLINQYINH